jgi:hypothetical protein
MAGASGLFGTANLAAGTSDRHADSASHTDYTRKNDHPLRKRQGAEPASRPLAYPIDYEGFLFEREPYGTSLERYVNSPA